MKRLLPTLLILCLVMSLAPAAFASGTEPLPAEDALSEDIPSVDAAPDADVLPPDADPDVPEEPADDPALDGGVTDSGDGQIIRMTTTYYHTTVIAEATATNSLTGETVTFEALESDELDGNTDDENVAAVIEDYRSRIQAWADSLGIVASIEFEEGVASYYYDAHDEITQSSGSSGGDVILVGDIDDLDNAYAAQGTVTINTILDKHQTYNLTGTVTFTPKADPSPKDVYIDNTVDTSTSVVIGRVVVSDNRTGGESTTEEVYNKSAAVTYSNPKPAEVTAMIAEAEKAARDYADAHGLTITVDCVVTESTPSAADNTLWDNRKYETVEDGDAVLIGDTDYLTGAYGVDTAYTRTHIASGDYGKTTTYTVTLEAEAGYVFLEGMNGVWTQGGSSDLSFRASGDYVRFIGVKVDGEELDPENYTSASGSTIVDLKASYLDTLSVGKHTLTVVYTDGEVSTDFTIAAKQAAAQTPAKAAPAGSAPAKSAPRTGDGQNPGLWLAVALLCAGGAAVLLPKTKKHHV